MYVFGEINKSSTLIESNVVGYTHNVSSSDVGITSISIVSGSTNNKYWQSLNVLFYPSGSPEYGGETKFSEAVNNFSLNLTNGTQYLNKFHGYSSCSIFQVPQIYYLDKIKEKSFTLTDNTNSSTVTLKDDGFGNLYSVNNTISHSTNSPSASDNYVGNIFYNHGLAVVTETSSYSHTASTASISVGTLSGPALAGVNHFFITSSDLSTSLKFISTGSTETDTDTIKYFASASTSAVTAQSASKKINDVFVGVHISSSVAGTVVTMSNDANLLKNRRPSTTLADLPPISGSAGFDTTKGFGGGTAAINYSDIGTNYNLKFDSQYSITTCEWNVTVLPQHHNHSMNYTLRSPISGSLDLSTRYLAREFTGSNFQPYITTINLYQNGDYYTPVITATLPRAIMKSKKIAITFKIKLDI